MKQLLSNVAKIIFNTKKEDRCLFLLLKAIICWKLENILLCYKIMQNITKYNSDDAT